MTPKYADQHLKKRFYKIPSAVIHGCGQSGVALVSTAALIPHFVLPSISPSWQLSISSKN